MVHSFCFWRAPLWHLLSLAPEARKGLWRAQWITSPGTSQRDSVVLRFRKIVEIDRVPEHFPIRVSADNQFIFYANQQEVGRGPAHGDVAHWRYETYDLAPLLHAGRNELAATVWNFGVFSPLAQISDRIGFLLCGETDSERVADTNASWEVEEEKGIRICRIHPNSSGTTTSQNLRSRSMAPPTIGFGAMPHVRGEVAERCLDWKCDRAGSGAAKHQLAVGAGLAARCANAGRAHWTCRTQFRNGDAARLSGKANGNSRSRQSNSLARPLATDDRIP